MRSVEGPAENYEGLEGEQIPVSDVTRQPVAGSGLPISERRRVRLKGFPGYHRVFELDWKELA